MVNYTKMAKKGQNAVPIILISMAVFMLIYFIMVYPSERARILQGDIDDTISTSPLGEDTNLIFSSGEIVEIGRSSGESVFKFRLNDVDVQYSAEERVLSSTEMISKVNIFSGDSKEFSANNLNLDNTKEVIIRLTVGELKGTPIIIINLNETKMLEKTLQEGEFDIKIQHSLLSENNPISVKIKHAGAFWTGQAADMNVQIIQVFYSPVKPVQEQIVTLGQTNIQGNEVVVSFVPIKAVDDGELIVKINEGIVFSGYVEENQTFSFSKRLDYSGIRVGENSIKFEADKGGVYELESVSLEFIAVATPATSKVYSFNIERTDLASGKDFVLGIRTDRIIKPGTITAKLEGSSTLYYFTSTELAAGAWTYATLNSTYLKELGNKITLDSPNGRYRITGFTVILV